MPLLTILKGFKQCWQKTYKYTLDPLLDPLLDPQTEDLRGKIRKIKIQKSP